MDCIFCGILSGQIPCYKIFEDEYTMAFLDISRDVDGHTLVIPKKHVTNMLDCDQNTWIHVMNTAKKIATHYISLGYDGVNILNANGEAAEQSVFHLHVHLFPRKKEDGAFLWSVNNVSKCSLEHMAEKLQMPFVQDKR